jgi:hypothetical protein
MVRQRAPNVLCEHMLGGERTPRLEAVACGAHTTRAEVEDRHALKPALAPRQRRRRAIMGRTGYRSIARLPGSRRPMALEGWMCPVGTIEHMTGEGVLTWRGYTFASPRYRPLHSGGEGEGDQAVRL